MWKLQVINASHRNNIYPVTCDKYDVAHYCGDSIRPSPDPYPYDA